MSEVDTSTLKLTNLQDAQTLTTLLSLLFEPSPPLHSLLVPSVLLRLTARAEPPTSYNQVIDICSEVAEGWIWSQKAEFLSGHPMIGAPKVSGLSGKEQGQGPVTPQVVLDRLEHLNTLFCKVYPGLRYITFVNSRPRSAILSEMEQVLNIPPSPVPLPTDYSARTPSLDSEEVVTLIKSPESDEWKQECERGLRDVWTIGRARLQSLQLE